MAHTNAQIGIGISSPETSTVIDVSNTNKGFYVSDYLQQNEME